MTIFRKLKSISLGDKLDKYIEYEYDSKEKAPMFSSTNVRSVRILQNNRKGTEIIIYKMENGDRITLKGRESNPESMNE